MKDTILGIVLVILIVGCTQTQTHNYDGGYASYNPPGLGVAIKGEKLIIINLFGPNIESECVQVSGGIIYKDLNGGKRKILVVSKDTLFLPTYNRQGIYLVKTVNKEKEDGKVANKTN